MTDGCQGSAECAVTCWKANRNHIEPQLDGTLKLQQGQVLVRAGLVVSGVDQHFYHSPLLLCLLNPLTIMLPFTAKMKVSFVHILNENCHDCKTIDS